MTDTTSASTATAGASGAAGEPDGVAGADDRSAASRNGGSGAAPAEETGLGDAGTEAAGTDGVAAGTEPAGTDGVAAGTDEVVAEAADGDGAESPAGDAAPAGSGRPAGARTADLFHESEIAADYVEGLLDILDLDGDIDELVVSGRPMVEVIEGGDGSGRRLQSLVGTRGVTLEALQELTRLAVYRQTGSPSRLLLDVGGYRTMRRKELTAIAKNAAEKVKEYGEPVRLEVMSAFERKCVHDVINAMSGIESESEGVEPTRRVVIRNVR